MRPYGLTSRENLPQGYSVGRYLVLSRIGMGRQSVVYAAYDPERGRKVALKLLLTDGCSLDGAAQSQQRLLQQAQALARLSHPQVVSIYEIVSLDSLVCIVMEFIEGLPFTKWMQRQPRSQQEILDAFILAGRGLAAMHTAGLFCTNFKLDNVLIDQRGQVRVTDLGLIDDEHPAPTSSVPGQLEFSFGPLDNSVQSQSTLLIKGTAPSGMQYYTAPEQIEGKPVEVRTDIFNFCAALYGSLYGVPPFAGNTPAERLANIVSGKLSSVPVGTHPPQGWMRQALLRGLRAEPDRRYPSMNTLLSALSRQQWQRRWWWFGGSAAAALCVLLLFGGYISVLIKRQQLLCSGAAAKLAMVWDPGRRAAIHDALGRTGKPYAEETWQRVEQALDRYSAQWVATYTEACQATRIRGEQSESLLDIRMRCLDRRLSELTALTHSLSAVNEAWLDKVVSAAQGLPPVSLCSDVSMLTAPIPLPEDSVKRERVISLQRQLAEIQTMDRLGQYIKGQEQAQLVVQNALQIGHAPLEAEALYWLGGMQKRRSQNEAAGETLLRAAAAAVAGRDPRMAAKAWSQLILVSGYGLHQPDAVHKWELLASAALRAAGNTPEIEAELANARCLAAFYKPLEDHTLALCQQSVFISTKVYGPSHFYVSLQLNNLAGILTQRKQHDQALQLTRQALAITQQQLGESHPNVAMYLSNLGESLSNQERYREGLPYSRQAVELMLRVLGTEDPQLGLGMSTLGELQFGDGQVAAADATLKRAVQILQKGLPKGHPYLISTQCNLVRVLLAQEHNAAAQRLAETMLLNGDTLSADRPEIADAHFLLGQALARQQRYSEALDHHKQSLVFHEKAHSDTERVSDLSAVGTDLIRLGHTQEALPLLEQAVQASMSSGISADVGAASQFALAQALWQLNRRENFNRVLTLTANARAAFARGEAKHQVERDELDHWLAAQHLSIKGVPE